MPFLPVKIRKETIDWVDDREKREEGGEREKRTGLSREEAESPTIETCLAR